MRLYTVQCTLKFIWLADFVFLLYVAQSRQSARIFLQSSEFKSREVKKCINVYSKDDLKALTDHLGGGSRVYSFDPYW